MTENEAKQWLKHTRAYQYKCDNCEYIDINGACNEECKDFYDMAIQALEEIQQYRAIGTVAGYERAIEISKENFRLSMEYKAKVQQYESIGTVEECQTAVERMKPRKVVNKKGFIIAKDKGGNVFYEANPYCPSCNTPIDNGGTAKGVYCKWCGQRFDWSE